MMSNWLSYNKEERLAMLQRVADLRHLPENAVEKDWWVTKCLQGLFSTEIGPFCRFKGGTSLSKGWLLINRFSEDIDIALSPRFFGLPTDNNTQLKKLRKTCRNYLVENLPQQLTNALLAMEVDGFNVKPVTEFDGVPVSSESDPTVINLNYVSIAERQSSFIKPVVKLEISCLSMEEPSLLKRIGTMIGEQYPDDDQNSQFDVLTAHPSRTFLEKAFLLCEEFQKDKPRSLRMSRHLYDLERLMDTEFAAAALQDAKLYKDIVEHRRKFYHLGYANYEKDYPKEITICPTDKCYDDYEADYHALTTDLVYGPVLAYRDLIVRIRELEQRFREMEI